MDDIFRAMAYSRVCLKTLNLDGSVAMIEALDSEYANLVTEAESGVWSGTRSD